MSRSTVLTFHDLGARWGWVVSAKPGSFPGVKRPGRSADHPPPSNCRGHERVQLYLYSPSGPSWSVIGRTLYFLLFVVLYGYGTWSLTLREKHRLRVFGDRVLRNVFGPERDGVVDSRRRLHYKILYSSPNIFG